MLNPYAPETHALKDNENAQRDAEAIINKNLCPYLYNSRAEISDQIASLLAFGRKESWHVLNQNKRTLLLLANEILVKKELSGKKIDQFLRPIYPNNVRYPR